MKRETLRHDVSFEGVKERDWSEKGLEAENTERALPSAQVWSGQKSNYNYYWPRIQGRHQLQSDEPFGDAWMDLNSFPYPMFNDLRSLLLVFYYKIINMYFVVIIVIFKFVHLFVFLQSTSLITNGATDA